MPKLTTKELRAIQAEAHKIRTSNPTLQWKDCVKKAGRKYCKTR